MGDYSCVLEVNLTDQDCPQFSINPEAGFECKMCKNCGFTGTAQLWPSQHTGELEQVGQPRNSVLTKIFLCLLALVQWFDFALVPLTCCSSSPFSSAIPHPSLYLIL
jgi:hypothetical protein